MGSIDAKEEFEAFFDEHDDFFDIKELKMKTEDFGAIDTRKSMEVLMKFMITKNLRRHQRLG